MSEQSTAEVLRCDGPKFPQWELNMMIDVAERWDIKPTEAENQLVEWGLLD